jgi:hypothetical protein
MSPHPRRRFERLQVRVPATLSDGPRASEALTVDVSREGLRLRVDDPPPPRRVVRITLALPPDGASVTLNGIIVNVIGRGVGIRLYGNPAEAVSRWERFVARVSAVIGTTPVGLEAVVTQTRRRRFRRVQEVFEVRCAWIDEIASRLDGSRGWFLQTDVPPTAGAEIGMELVHPATGALFPVRARVRRVVHEVETGVSVEPLDLDAARAEALEEFLVSGIPALENEDVEGLDDIGYDELFGDLEEALVG